MSVVGSTKQAVQVARDGADVVIAQGTEGGGHTGHVGTMALLPQVLDAVDVPVVAAGGIGDGRGLAAALVMGCQARVGRHPLPRHRRVRPRRLAEGRAARRRRPVAGDQPRLHRQAVPAAARTGGPRRGSRPRSTRCPCHCNRCSPGWALGAMATDRGGRQGVSMNGAGNIAGLLTEVLPAATVVQRMAAEAAARLTAR